MGILVANVRQMFLPWATAEFPVSLGGSERLAWIDWQLFHSLVDLKFLTLFSLLFGVGFALQAGRVQTGDAGFFGLYLRRLGILALLGVAHGLLLYPAEVLMPYAVAGFMLLLAHNWTGTTLVRVGLFLVAISTVWQYQLASIRPISLDVIGITAALLAVTLSLMWRPRPWVAVILVAAIMCSSAWVLTTRAAPNGHGAVASEYRDARDQLAAMRTDSPSAWPEELRVRREGGFDGLVWLHMRQYADILLGFAVVLIWRTLGLFMIGAGLFRLSLFDGHSPSVWNRVAVVGLGIGVPLTVVATWLYGRAILGLADWRFPDFLHKISALVLAAGTAGAVFVWQRQRQNSWIGHHLEAAGRMPLTNYVGQSLIMAALAEPWGFNGYGRMSGPMLTTLALVVFVVLAIASRGWLARFRMGPLEWMWRCVTYWRLVPLRGSPFG
jgi:uncharacterized protein